MSEQWTVILADQQAILSDALAALLVQRGHNVIATPPTRPELVAALREFQPDVCITDTQLRHEQGPGAFAELRECSPSSLLVVLTADDRPEVLNQALAAGASGYVQKTRGVSVLLDALARAWNGEVVIEGSFSRQPVNEPPSGLARLASYLTPRELECLALLTGGYDTAGMSAALGVSRTTVRTHVQAVLTKLGVHSRLEAVSMATRYGLVVAQPVLAGPRTDRRSAAVAVAVGYGTVAEPFSRR
jgi:DNA-binding NarL/FixJ family response regulator